MTVFELLEKAGPLIFPRNKCVGTKPWHHSEILTDCVMVHLHGHGSIIRRPLTTLRPKNLANPTCLGRGCCRLTWRQVRHWVAWRYHHTGDLFDNTIVGLVAVMKMVAEIGWYTRGVSIWSENDWSLTDNALTKSTINHTPLCNDGDDNLDPELGPVGYANEGGRACVCLRCVSFGSFVRDYQLFVLSSLSVCSCSPTNLSPKNQSQSQPQSLSLSQKPTRKRIHHCKRASFLKIGTRSCGGHWFLGATRVIIICLKTRPRRLWSWAHHHLPHRLMLARLHSCHLQSDPPLHRYLPYQAHAPPLARDKFPPRHHTVK